MYFTYIYAPSGIQSVYEQCRFFFLQMWKIHVTLHTCWNGIHLRVEFT